MENLKGLILSGGAGTRLRPITHTSAKQLVPVANKPVLFYGIEALVAAGVEEIGIVIAPETGEEIQAAVGDGSALGARVTYIPQAAPLGLAHAVLTAEEYLGDSAFVMYLGDNLLRDGITDLVDAFRRHEPEALIMLTQVLDPEHYGVAELEGDRIVRLIEKPSDPPSDLALVGVYMFKPSVFAAAKQVSASPRGELEITDTIQRLIDDGAQVEWHRVKGWWKDTGQLADMLEANRLVLEDLEPRVDGELIDSRVEGRVIVAEGAVVERTTIRGPAVIGAGSRMIDSYIGPYTSIGERCRVEGSEVEHSILLPGASVSHLATRMEASLLGRDVRVSRGDGLPKTIRMIVGDSSELTLP
jgi:glucose-1-phosphate thymidylyltransferase